MKTIPLTQGKFALVDDEDFERLNARAWYAAKRNHTFYAFSSCGDDKIIMHREIMKAPTGLQIDHINGKGLDNQKKNLRLATRNQNNRNSRKQTNTSSRFKGVTWYKRDGSWQAQLKLQPHNIYLGRFASEEAAARAYDAAAREYFGKFARPNFSEA